MTRPASDLIRELFWFDIERAMIDAALVEKAMIEGETAPVPVCSDEDFVIRIYCAMERVRRERELHDCLAKASSNHAKARAGVQEPLGAELSAVGPLPDPWRHGQCFRTVGTYSVRQAHTEAEGRRMDDLVASLEGLRASSQRKTHERSSGESSLIAVEPEDSTTSAASLQQPEQVQS